MLALASLGRPDHPKELLVYVPAKPPVTDEERQADPFAVYAACGAVFPGGDGDGYESLCLKAKPDNATEIRRLFAENPSPSFALIDNIGGGLYWPTLRTCLQAESAREILLALLVPSPKQMEALKANEAWAPEARALLEKSLGLKLMTKGKTLLAHRRRALAVSAVQRVRFRSSLRPSRMLSPTSPGRPRRRGRWWRICATPFETASRSRNEYIARAENVEEELELPEICSGGRSPGNAGHLPLRGASIPEAGGKGAVAPTTSMGLELSSCNAAIRSGSAKVRARRNGALSKSGLRLVEGCDDADRQLADNSRSLDALIAHYVASLRDVDRLQREFEQAVGDYVSIDACLSDAVDHCRRRYAKLAEKVQSLFTKHLETAGWPPQGRMSNADVFDTIVGPMLKESGRRVAFIMVDALRYELGVTLHRQLAETEQPEIRAVCAQLPTVTPCGHGVASSRSGFGPTAMQGRGWLLRGSGRSQDSLGVQSHGRHARPLWRPVRGDPAGLVRQVQNQVAGIGRALRSAYRRHRRPLGERAVRCAQYPESRQPVIEVNPRGGPQAEAGGLHRCGDRHRPWVRAERPCRGGRRVRQARGRLDRRA